MPEVGKTGPKRSSSAQVVKLSRKPVQYTGRALALISGEISIHELTMDELRLGKLMNDEGKFVGGTPKPLPPVIVAQMRRELNTRLLDEFNKHGQDAIQTIIDVMYAGEGASSGPMQKDGTGRLKAAQYVIERIVGKIPDKLETTQNVTIWQGVAEGGDLFIDVEADDIQEAEVVQETKSQAGQGPRTGPKRGPRTRPQRKTG